MGDMRQAAEDADQDGGDIGKEAVKLYQYVSEPGEEMQGLAFLYGTGFADDDGDDVPLLN